GETLRHGRFGHQEGSCDFLGREAAEQAESERHLRFRGGGRVAAREDEAKPVVLHVAVPFWRAGIVVAARKDRRLAQQFPSRDSRRKRSMARLRAVVVIHAPGLGGRPSPVHLRRATANASCTASSATSMSPKTRIRAATDRPDSSRKIRPTSASS